MTIQRYSQKKERHDIYNVDLPDNELEIDKDGKLLLYDDIKHLIEWKSLTLKRMPEFDTDFFMWPMNRDEPIVVQLSLRTLKTDNGDVKEFYVFYMWEEDDSECYEEYVVGRDNVKWKAFDNPWNKS